MTGLGESDLSEYFSGLAMGRARLCRLLAALLTCPDQALMHAFTDGSLWSQCIGIAAAMNDDRLLSALEHARSAQGAAQSGEWFKEQRVEYTRLFCQIPLLVSPYGGQYGDGSVDEEREVRRRYADTGIVVRADFHERADHLAAEFDYLFYLAHAEALAWGQGDHEEAREWQEMERAFHAEHVKRFAQGFGLAVEENTTSALYAFVARLVEAVASDAFFE